jgi:hypothetical protein
VLWLGRFVVTELTRVHTLEAEINAVAAPEAVKVQQDAPPIEEASSE